MQQVTDTYRFAQGGCVNVSNIVKQITVGAKLADNHDWRFFGIFWYTDAQLMNNVRMKS